jgi:hypothetical protein
LPHWEPEQVRPKLGHWILFPFPQRAFVVTLLAEEDGEATAGAEERVLVRSVVKDPVAEQAPKAILQPIPQYLSTSVIHRL